ncbi:hypothetical protein FRC02_000609 [Tulasnella sp. 418]|nr:hypothetical protein FRC02_000609 [Tulasnella sp. 418]
MDPAAPPFYILVSDKTIAPAAPGLNPIPAGPSALVHPASVHYHYADDPPMHLLPPSNETFLVIDYDPSSSEPPTAHSLSDDVVVTGLKVTEGPTPASASPSGFRDMDLNGNMYVIETMSRSASKRKTTKQDAVDPTAVIANFQSRNEQLRKALEYGAPISPSTGVVGTSPQDNTPPGPRTFVSQFSS